MSYKFSGTDVNSNKCGNLIHITLNPDKFENNFIKRFTHTMINGS